MAQLPLETIVILVILVIVAVTVVILFSTGIAGGAGGFFDFSNETTGSLYDKTKEGVQNL